HRRMDSRTEVSEEARLPARSSRSARMCRASRVAVFSPTPGNRLSWEMSSLSGLGYGSISGEVEGQRQTAGELLHLFRHELPGLAQPLVYRGQDEVFEHGYVVAVHA